MDDVVYSADEVYERCPGLTEADVSFLKTIEGQMSIVADVSRADILLYGSWDADRSMVLSHAQPHSISPVYEHVRTGREFDTDQEPMIIRTLTDGRPQQGGQLLTANSAPIMKQVFPLRRPGEKQTIAAFSVETNLLEHERHRRRRRARLRRARSSASQLPRPSAFQ